MDNPEDSDPRSSGGKTADWLGVLFGVPLSIFGGLVTLIFGLLVCMYVASRVGGGPRVPDLLGFGLLWLFFGAAPLGLGSLMLWHASKPPISGRIFLAVLLLFITIGADALCGPKNWRGVFRREKVVRGEAANFKGTFVTAHLDSEIGPGTNLLWCGTFQLAWNEACDLAGGDLQLVGPELQSLLQHPMAAALNQHAFTKDCIDEASYVAMAGFVKDHIHEKILGAARDKFHGKFEPGLVPDKGLTPQPQDFVAYACLWKQLSFPVAFERLEDSFRFGGAQVRAFGLGKTKASHESMRPQVQILDYQSEDDFVVQLKTKSEGDRLILAKAQGRGSLRDMLTRVRERVAHGKAEPTGTNDVLMVPRMKLDITRKYTEIVGHWLVPFGRKVAPALFVQSAAQSIRFDMDERGVELQSEAHMAMACGKEPEPVRQHIMVFNKPFLVLLERAGARMPYFALWVDNPEGPRRMVTRVRDHGSQKDVTK